MVDTIERTTRDPSPAELRALVDLAPDGIFVADIDGRYTFVNEAGCRLLGCSVDEIIGKTIVDLIPAEDVDRLLASKSRMLRGENDSDEWKLRRKDGQWIPVEVNAKILPDGQWLGVVRDISERNAHEAERDAALKEAESDRRWLHTVLDTMPLGVLLFQPGGRFSFNRRTEELLGMELSPDGGSAQYASRILFPDGRPVPPEELVTTRVLRDGETIIAAEFRVRRGDGAQIPVLSSGAPIRDAAGRVIGGVGVFQDMSERMRMEQAIRANERLLRGIFDILPVGVWIADKTGRIVSNNPAGERVWRGARYVPVADFGQYKGWWADTGKPIAADEWALARALTRGETSTAELIRIQCFDGSFKTIINSAAPLRDENGEIAGAIVVNEDITALHEAQEKQRASEQLLRTVFELLPVGVWIADREGRITLTNPAGQRIWAGARHVDIDQYSEYKGWWVETGKPIEADEWGLARAVRRGEVSHGELIRIQCLDGSFKTVMNWAAPIRSDSGEIAGAVAVNEDVTSLQHTQEQLRAAVRDREQILAIVAHDLRSPLNSLTMSATAAERKVRELPGGEPVRALAASLVDVSRRMSGMVDDLLAVGVAATGGPSMLRLEPVAASSLLERAAQAARPLLARQSLQLELKVTGDLPTIHVDADRVLRVFANLLDNALKFTSPPGRITLAAERSAGGVRFSVANSGPALSPEQLDAMFQPFWQAARDRRGAGLGLSICRSIVEAHGGSIWAEPVEGERVRVCFVLPRQPAAGA
jgi:PAS domain S-box-containing protein